jgi:peptidoglycan/LPS O-acetylase OafA/YrhL
MESSRRRRPPARPPAPSPPPATPPRRARPSFGSIPLVAGVGLIVVVAVIAVAFATGTADDLPWGAIAGVVVILAIMVVTGRRRARSIREAFPDDEG